MNVSMLILLLSQFYYLLSCCVGCMCLFVCVCAFPFRFNVVCYSHRWYWIQFLVSIFHIFVVIFLFCKVNTIEQKYWRQKKSERNPTIMNRTMLTLLLFSLLPISCILMMLSRCFRNDEPKTQAMNPLLERPSIPHT